MKYFLLSLSALLLVLFFFEKGAKSSEFSDLHQTQEVSREKRKKPKGTFQEKENRAPFSHLEEEEKKNVFLVKKFEEKSLKHFERKKNTFLDEPLFPREFLSDQDFLELARKSLLNLEWLCKGYPKNQPYMRLLALDFLKERSLEEGSSFLTDFINNLFQNWEENKDYPGASDDLMELVMAWVEREGRDKIYKDPAYLFSSLNYEKKHRKIFSRALSNLYPEAVPNSKETREILKLLEGMG